MISFSSPIYFLGLLSLPLFYIVYYKSSQKREGSFRISSVSIFSDQIKRKGLLKIRLVNFMHFFVIALLLLGLTRPQRIDSIKEVSVEIIDIMLVMDISSSMLATDFLPNRLEVAKKTAKQFIKNRDGDRLGMLVFAGESFIQCPLTVDIKVMDSLVDEIKIAEQSYDGTAIGMAIANATNRLRRSNSKSKVMILLSDGSNNAGELDPITAAELASKFNIKIYTIGAGTNNDVSFIPGRGYIRNEIDEETLKSIAVKTGGQYFRAIDISGLEKIYNTINNLERTEIKIKDYTRHSELFGWFIFPALFLSIFMDGVERIFFRRRL